MCKHPGGLARLRTARAVLVAAAALAVTGGTATMASAAGVPAAHRTLAASSGFHRACAATRKPGRMFCMALIRDGVTAHASGTAPTGIGYGPADLKSAYNLPAGGGEGTKVAVVDAYNDPNAVSDLAAYRAAWGQAACNAATGAGCLTVTNQNGATTPLPANAGTTGWATEESLDVDMVSAICPTCHIYLVEANSATTANLGTGVKSAATVIKAIAVSNSYGGADSSSDAANDTAYYKQPGVAVTASAGDDGYGVSYPAASQYVVAVGGTTLTKGGGGARGWTETAWSGTGSGCSAYEAKPAWQTDTGCRKRTDNDVAAVADPDTGVAVYDTYDQSGWLEVGGTSASSPIIAGVFALAGPLPAGSYGAQRPYAAEPAGLYDITAGSNGSCTPAYLCTAGPGYDGPTGWGTPDGIGAF